MEYKKYGGTYYVRMDRGDEIISQIICLCEKERIYSAIFSEIGGCGEACLQTFIPETGIFETEVLSGMLELVSLNGNIIHDNAGKYFHHTHAVFSYKKGSQHYVAGGHLQSVTVSYTAELEVRPVNGGTILREYDEETGTGFWKFGN